LFFLFDMLHRYLKAWCSLPFLALALLICQTVLSGCASRAGDSDDGNQPLAQELIASAWTQNAVLSADSGVGATPWQHFTLPGKQPNKFASVRDSGREAMRVQSSSSVSMLRQNVAVQPDDLGRVRFGWKVTELNELADMAVRDLDDSHVRIVLAFEGDRSKLSAKNAMLSELTRALTGEPMPYATLMYVWCNNRPSGSVILNPRTDRIRKIVVETGPQNLGRWMDYERNVRADFEATFGEAPGPLVAIGIMTDTDNTKSTANVMYGQVKLLNK
jgi:Protein of unknown function (DUF3047)